MVEGTLKFIVILDQEEDGGYSIHCPAVQCSSQGDNRAEALEMIVDAIQGMLEAYEELKESNPLLIPLPIEETPELISDEVRIILGFRADRSLPMTLELTEVVVPARVMV